MQKNRRVTSTTTTTSSESAQPEPGSEHQHCCEHHETLCLLEGLSKIVAAAREKINDQAFDYNMVVMDPGLSIPERDVALAKLLRFTKTVELLGAGEELLVQALEVYALDAAEEPYEDEEAA